jgi:transcriptional regulator with XRE-family HTH domain
MSPLRLRALREAAGLSQEDLAARVATRQATISDLERGKARRIDLRLIDRLAAVLGIEPGELFERTAGRKARRSS